MVIGLTFAFLLVLCCCCCCIYYCIEEGDIQENATSTAANQGTAVPAVAIPRSEPERNERGNNTDINNQEFVGYRADESAILQPPPPQYIPPLSTPASRPGPGGLPYGPQPPVTSMGLGGGDFRGGVFGMGPQQDAGLGPGGGRGVPSYGPWINPNSTT